MFIARDHTITLFFLVFGGANGDLDLLRGDWCRNLADSMASLSECLLSPQNPTISRTFTPTIKSMRLSSQLVRLICLPGPFPLRQRRLVEAWAELHQQELLADWELLVQGRRPAKIAPLQ